jgi:hypothetical protein
VHRGMGDAAWPGVAMPIDRGPMQFRRQASRRIAQEAGVELATGARAPVAGVIGNG